MNPFNNPVPPHLRHPVPHAAPAGVRPLASTPQPAPVRAQQGEPARAPASRAELAQRQQALTDAALQLKAELFGIDDVIDRVIDAIRAWYVLPQLITRPVIVCLWGLTGTGKTQLTRRLAQLLGFYDRFVEVQMDGFSHGASYRSSSISGMLGDSGIHEGAPGMLVLDEFQRFRTVSTKGEEVKVERYQDVWTLLSDGRLPPALSALTNIERKLADAHYEAERADDNEDERAGKKPYRFQLDAWDAQELKRMLKLSEPLAEIMQWPPTQVQALFTRFQQSLSSWETDYSKLLVFVCGNLDEMYHETAQRVEDCDTDADIFHRLTRKLSLIDVKKALSERFKPEQIARLGNEHVIYPSFNKATYEQLIRNLCTRYCDDIAAQCGVRFAIGQDVLDELYANAVFPAQGTRPLFSSVHAILSANLVNAALWVLEQQLPLAQDFVIALAADKRHLVVHGLGGQGDVQQAQFGVTLELNRLKQRANADFRALLAVHEAGHGLVYCLLFGQAPQEVKINIASFEGGYNSFAGLKVTTRQNALDMMCVGLAGRVAEELVFGEMACTTGAEQDYKQVTAEAARFIRHHGFGTRLSRTDVTVELDNHLNTDVEPSNAAIEELLQSQYQRASTLLGQHRGALTRLVEALMDHGMIAQPEMQALMAQSGVAIAVAAHTGPDEALILEPFAARLAAFQQKTGGQPAHAPDSESPACL
ncbi:peptidase M41 [Acidovorax sp. Root275]|uniref:AAA family ATPase n=1 Tax=Acidovorax sp. Root275 TaxID=1736508 RepID=UPI00070F8172|nr:AAA family ATPase [Acidovorax sp. Root275]KRD55443.1 peptidase M41 [Acidovorax sp. Root275]